MNPAVTNNYVLLVVSGTYELKIKVRKAMRMQNVCAAEVHRDMLEHCAYDGCPALFVPRTVPVFCFFDRQTDRHSQRGWNKKYNP